MTRSSFQKPVIAAALAASAFVLAVAPSVLAHSAVCINDVPHVAFFETQECLFSCQAGDELSIYVRGWNFTGSATCGGATVTCSIFDLSNLNEAKICHGGVAGYHDDSGECYSRGNSLSAGFKASIHCSP